MSDKPKITEQPDYKFWCPHFLKALHSLGGSAKFKEIYQELLSYFEVEDTVRDEVSEKRNNVLRFKIHQARGKLKNSEYIYNPEWATLALNDMAKKEIPEILETLKKLEKDNANEYISETIKYWENKGKSRSKNGQSVGRKESADKQQDGNDFIVEEEQLIQEELGVIRNMDAHSFERLCRTFLIRSGYENVNLTQKTRDGGYDGSGYLVFGLVRFKVAFEAKKYTPPSVVQETDIRNFDSAMRRKAKAEKGVYITTARFTRDAIKYAEEHLDGMLTLIDGEGLIKLLREKQIGYSQKFVIDKEFFKNF